MKSTHAESKVCFIGANNVVRWSTQLAGYKNSPAQQCPNPVPFLPLCVLHTPCRWLMLITCFHQHCKNVCSKNLDVFFSWLLKSSSQGIIFCLAIWFGGFTGFEWPRSHFTLWFMFLENRFEVTLASLLGRSPLGFSSCSESESVSSGVGCRSSLRSSHCSLVSSQKMSLWVGLDTNRILSVRWLSPS